MARTVSRPACSAPGADRPGPLAPRASSFAVRSVVLPARSQFDAVDVTEDSEHVLDVLNVEVVPVRRFVRTLIQEQPHKVLFGDAQDRVQALKQQVWAAAGPVDTDLSFSSFLKVYRTDVAHR